MNYSRSNRRESFSSPFNVLSNFNSSNNNQQNIQSYNSDIDSDSSSPPASTISYASSNSSSLANSPLLTSSLFPISNVPHLSLSSAHLINSTPNEQSQYKSSPSPNDLAHYASSIIRNEAYALLALADRLTPSGPILDEVPFQVDLLETDSNSSGSMMMDQDIMGGSQEQSRTNIAFRGVYESLKSLPSHGKVIVTGVGKSGIVARKMVATFNSLGKYLSYSSISGTRSIFSFIYNIRSNLYTLLLIFFSK